MNVTVNENEEVFIVLNVSEPGGDEIIFLGENFPEGAVLDGNVFRWKTDFDVVKKDSFIDSFLDKYGLLEKSFRVTFGAKSNELLVTREATINIRNVNRAPVIGDFEEIVVKEGESFVIVPDAFDPDGDNIRFVYSGWIDTNGKKVGFDEQGRYIINVFVSDGELSASKAAAVNVVNVNRPPVLNPVGNFEVDENSTLTVGLSSSEPDGDSVGYFVDDIGVELGAEIVNGSFAWRPDFNAVRKDAENFVFRITASDGEFNSSQEINVAVRNINRPPVVLNTVPEINSFAYLGDKVKFEIEEVEPDGDELTYKWKTGFFEEYRGKTKLVRKFSSLGRKTVKVVVSDGEFSEEFEWSVMVIKRPKK